MADHHYLGAGRPVGDYLRPIVEVHGRPAALQVWGPACYALKDRDRWIGWSANHRIERLNLIVQNRRLLILEEKGVAPNLASRTMGAALRLLPAQSQQCFGCRAATSGDLYRSGGLRRHLLQGQKLAVGGHECRLQPASGGLLRAKRSPEKTLALRTRGPGSASN